MKNSLRPEMQACIASSVKAHQKTQIVKASRLARNIAEAMPVAEWGASAADVHEEVVRVAVEQGKALRLEPQAAPEPEAT